MYGTDTGTDTNTGVYDVSIDHYKFSRLRKKWKPIATSHDKLYPSPHLGTLVAKVIGWGGLSYTIGLLSGNVLYMLLMFFVGIFAYATYVIIIDDERT
jgi:hypothetical protein